MFSLLGVYTPEKFSEKSWAILSVGFLYFLYFVPLNYLAVVSINIKLSWFFTLVQNVWFTFVWTHLLEPWSSLFHHCSAISLAFCNCWHLLLTCSSCSLSKVESTQEGTHFDADKPLFPLRIFTENQMMTAKVLPLHAVLLLPCRHK